MGHFFYARNKLVQFGLITYDKGKRNLDTPVYQIIKLYEDWGRTNTKTGYVTVELIRRNNQIVQRKILLSAKEGINKKVKNPINKKVKGNNTSINNKKEIKEKVNVLPIQKLSSYYQQNIGVIRPLILEDMRAYLADFTEQGTSVSEATQIIELAIKTAVNNNKPSWNYASACLRNWINESLFTLEAIKTALKQHKANRHIQIGARGFTFIS